MKTVLILVGIVLIVSGLGSLVTGGFSFSHQKKDVDAGPIQISHESTKHVPVAPVVSVVAMLGGAALIFTGARMR